MFGMNSDAAGYEMASETPESLSLYLSLSSVQPVPMGGGWEGFLANGPSAVAGFSRRRTPATSLRSKTPKFHHLPKPAALEPWFRSVISLHSKNPVRFWGCLVASWVVGGG